MSIFLIALGAIIAFGVEASLSWIDLPVVGWVLMLAGVTGLVLTFYFWNRGRVGAETVEERHYYDGRSTPPPRRAGTETVEERRYYGGRSTPPPRRSPAPPQR